MKPLTPGTKLTDMLTLVNVLGEGGMGTVWLANHRTLGTEVAVKVMHPELAHRDPSLLERFQSEAQAAAKIRHPHIVQMLDHGKTEDGTVWLAMELLEGESLGALLRGVGAVSAPFAVTVMKQVAGAVGKAHAAGIIHRDLKPENLQVLTVGGEPFVKVLDFGIAKVTTQSSGTTATSAVFGTPAYMSPEQLLSTKKVDAGADLWALSVIAYELLTGQLPFQGETSTAIAIAVATGHFAPPSSLKPHLGIALDAWFSRAFQKNAAARFPSAEELGATFAQAAGAHATGGQAVPLHPELQGSAQRAAGAALPQTKLVAPAFLAERGGTEVASSPHIPTVPAGTLSKREKGASTAWRNGLVIAGVAVVGVLGVGYLNGKKDTFGDTKTADGKTDAADRKPVGQGAEAKGHNEENMPGVTVELKAFIVMVTDEVTKENHPMKLSLAIELEKLAKKEEFEPFVPKIRDTVNEYIRSLSYQEIMKPRTVKRMTEDLLERIHKVGGESAKRVLVQEMVTQ